MEYAISGSYPASTSVSKPAFTKSIVFQILLYIGVLCEFAIKYYFVFVFDYLVYALRDRKSVV